MVDVGSPAAKVDSTRSAEKYDRWWTSKRYSEATRNFHKVMNNKFVGSFEEPTKKQWVGGNMNHLASTVELSYF